MTAQPLPSNPSTLEFSLTTRGLTVSGYASRSEDLQTFIDGLTRLLPVMPDVIAVLEEDAP